MSNSQLVYAVANTQKIMNHFMLKSIKKQWFYTWITKKLRKQFYQLKIVFNCMQTSSDNLWLFKIYFRNERRIKKIWKKKKNLKKKKIEKKKKMKKYKKI